MTKASTDPRIVRPPIDTLPASPAHTNVLAPVGAPLNLLPTLPTEPRIGPKTASAAEVANRVQSANTSGFTEARLRTLGPPPPPAWMAQVHSHSAAALGLTDEQLAATSYDEKAVLLHALASIPQHTKSSPGPDLAPYAQQAAQKIFSLLKPGDEVGFDRIYYRSDPGDLRKLVGSRGLDKLCAQFRTAPQPGDWAGWKQYTDGVTGSHSAGRNSAQFLINGAELMPAMGREIANAKSSINLSVFQWQADSIGNKMADALIAKAQAQPPVDVRVLVDGVGTDYRGAAAPLLQRMRDGGVQVVVNQDDTLFKSHLDHRKLMAIDGRVGFIGGMNVGEDYQVNWHDQQTELRGPAVADIQDAFLKQWRAQLDQHVEDGSPLPTSYRPGAMDLVKFYPHVSQAAGDSSSDTRIITHEGGSKDRNIKAAYLRAIDTAKDTIKIANPYFADSDIVDALAAAAKRGVKVQVELPQAHNDEPILVHASRAFYPKLLEAGVEVYEYNSRMAHEKVATFDGKLSTFGSSNLDTRSLENNDEANAWVMDSAVARDIDNRLFSVDLADPNTVRVKSYSPDLRGIFDRGLRSLL